MSGVAATPNLEKNTPVKITDNFRERKEQCVPQL